jgi:hypothetical protein
MQAFISSAWWAQNAPALSCLQFWSTLNTMIGDLKKRIQLFSWARLTEMEAREHTLKYLFWEATLLCNLECRHCGSDCTRAADTGGELETGEIKEVLRKIAGARNPRGVLNC